MKEFTVSTAKDRINVAFLDLLDEKPYSDITVTDIIKKAGVARVTYYRNYSSISEIIESITDKMAEDFVTDLIPMFSSKDDRRIREFLFDFFYRYKKNYNTFTPENAYNRNIIKSRLNIKITALENNSNMNHFEEKYSRVATLSVIDGIAQKWGNDGFMETPEEIIDYTLSIIKKI